jgi:uncharacterized protein (DUF1697 family)
MTSYVALLRGINVGGKNKVAMVDLRSLLIGLGFDNVRTHLNSGNAIFTSDGTDKAALAGRIEAAITNELGLEIRTLVRSSRDLQAVVDANPMADLARAEPAKFAVIFLSGRPSPARLAAIDPAEYAPDHCVLVGRELYAHFPNGMGRAKLTWQSAGKWLKQDVATARNWNTVLKLLDLTLSLSD